MIKNRLPIMPINRMQETAQRPAVRRRWTAMIVLLCAVTGTQPVQAQESDLEVTPGTNAIAGPNKSPGTNAATTANKDTGSNRGTLNFVDADIESVIAAVADY